MARLPEGITREEAYEERIAHLRSGIEILQQSQHEAANIINAEARPGFPYTTLGDLLLAADTERGIEQDAIKPL